MENYFFRENDRKQFKQKIEPNLKKGKRGHIYSSFTYITSNYSVLLFMQEMLSFARKHDLRVVLVIWDTSVFANSYYRRMNKQVGDEQFIEQKIEELYKIAHSMSFKGDDITIYKSSDLWKRFISYQDEDIYQGFYSSLVQMRVEEYALSYKASYFIQIPLNLFFCNYFHKLFPEDVDQRIDLIFIEEQREQMYTHSRRIMHELGITTYESPAFIIMEDIPYFNYNEYEPEWNMSNADIHEIISNIKPNKIEIMRVCNLLGVERPEPSLSESEAHSYLSKRIYEYLQQRKKACEQSTGKMEDRVIEINNRGELLQLGSIFRSRLAVDILVEADGKKKLSKIAKTLGKSIPTISTYVKRLRKMGLIKIKEDGSLKRTFKGFKTNFDLGLS